MKEQLQLDCVKTIVIKSPRTPLTGDGGSGILANNSSLSATNYLIAKFFCCFANSEAVKKRDVHYRISEEKIDKNVVQNKHVTENNKNEFQGGYSWQVGQLLNFLS